MTQLLFAEDHQVGYDGYKSRLKPKGWLWWLTGLSVDKQSAVVTTGVSLTLPGCFGGFRGRLRTTMLAFCGLWGRIRPHIVL